MHIRGYNHDRLLFDVGQKSPAYRKTTLEVWEHTFSRQYVYKETDSPRKHCQFSGYCFPSAQRTHNTNSLDTMQTAVERQAFAMWVRKTAAKYRRYAKIAGSEQRCRFRVARIHYRLWCVWFQEIREEQWNREKPRWSVHVLPRLITAPITERNAHTTGEESCKKMGTLRSNQPPS